MTIEAPKNIICPIENLPCRIEVVIIMIEVDPEIDPEIVLEIDPWIKGVVQELQYEVKTPMIIVIDCTRQMILWPMLKNEDVLHPLKGKQQNEQVPPVENAYGT
jgi:hypothetical protein